MEIEEKNGVVSVIPTGLKSAESHSLTEATKVAILLKNLNARIESSIDSHLNSLFKNTNNQTIERNKSMKTKIHYDAIARLAIKFLEILKKDCSTDMQEQVFLNDNNSQLKVYAYIILQNNGIAPVKKYIDLFIVESIYHYQLSLSLEQYRIKQQDNITEKKELRIETLYSV